MSEALHEPAVVQLYAAPLAEFIARRDALARELRSAGDRDAASAVKALRKPSRTAWALNRVVHARPDALASLDEAIAEYVEAQGGTGDVRAAMTALRMCVRKYASHAAAEARGAGMNLDENDLSTAVLAVLGSPDTYDDFRLGRMSDVPDAGGLDFLSSLPTRPRLEVSGPATRPASTPDPVAIEALEEEVREHVGAVEKARSGAEAADAALARLDAAVAAAQEKLDAARSELTAAQQQREFARRTKDASAAELRDAEAACRDAERRLAALRSSDA